ncbi:hypothetical protein MKX03_025203 [Papaver bracteatum]|nr:hypothetical protein MKX03_025203 [Papaver bracteatum]
MPERNEVSWNSLIGSLVRAGYLDEARRLFDGMMRRNVVSWAVMISGYCQNGYPREALALFWEMQYLAMQVFHSSEEKNISTYTAAISGLAYNGHMGSVEKGFHYFNSMVEVHGIKPELDHYTCMVDLLGRAGLLEEAERFINTMPITPDNVIWGALLGAWRTHSNVEMGQRVGNCLIESDPVHDVRYVLLSNIYGVSSKGDVLKKFREQ